MLEIACFDKESAIIAAKAGADRIEFCAGFEVGGTTPSLHDYMELKKEITIPIFVMIRTRGGDFCYNNEEFQKMKNQLLEFKKVGADGFVFGILDGNLDIANGQFTNHYNYNTKYEFDYNEYVVNGLSLNLLYDSRDNQINTNNGMFANINYRINPAFNQSQDVSSVLYGEYRYFLPLSKYNKQHVFSLWATAQFVTTGNVPYLNLPSIGWDQRSRSGKGYTQGLFRGQKMVYFETEYRFPISCNQLISGTVFANFTTASDKDREIRLFQYIQPAFGVGLRILIDKATRTNLVLNYAWGRHSDAFYLNAGESF